MERHIYDSILRTARSLSDMTSITADIRTIDGAAIRVSASRLNSPFRSRGVVRVEESPDMPQSLLLRVSGSDRHLILSAGEIDTDDIPSPPRWTGFIAGTEWRGGALPAAHPAIARLIARIETVFRIDVATPSSVWTAVNYPVRIGWMGERRPIFELAQGFPAYGVVCAALDRRDAAAPVRIRLPHWLPAPGCCASFVPAALPDFCDLPFIEIDEGEDGPSMFLDPTPAFGWRAYAGVWRNCRPVVVFASRMRDEEGVLLIGGED